MRLITKWQLIHFIFFKGRWFFAIWAIADENYIRTPQAAWNSWVIQFFWKAIGFCSKKKYFRWNSPKCISLIHRIHIFRRNSRMYMSSQSMNPEYFGKFRTSKGTLPQYVCYMDLYIFIFLNLWSESSYSAQCINNLGNKSPRSLRALQSYRTSNVFKWFGQENFYWLKIIRG